MGADIVVGEGQSIGVGLQFGGPYVGLFATREKYRPADARAALRRDRRRRGQTRLCADAIHSRAAYPPRKGDIEYLHQFRPLCVGIQHPHDFAWGEAGCASWPRLNHANAASAAERLSRVPGVDAGQRNFFQRIHPADCQRDARTVVHELAARRHPGRRFAGAALS